MTTTQQRILTPRSVTLRQALETTKRPTVVFLRAVSAAALTMVVPETALAQSSPAPETSLDRAFDGWIETIVGSGAAVGGVGLVVTDLVLLGTRGSFPLGYSIAHAAFGASVLNASLAFADRGNVAPEFVGLLALEGALLITIPIAEWALRGPDPSALSLRLTPGGASLAGAF